MRARCEASGPESTLPTQPHPVLTWSRCLCLGMVRSATLNPRGSRGLSLTLRLQHYMGEQRGAQAEPLDSATCPLYEGLYPLERCAQHGCMEGPLSPIDPIGLGSVHPCPPSPSPSPLIWSMKMCLPHRDTCLVGKPRFSPSRAHIPLAPSPPPSSTFC